MKPWSKRPTKRVVPVVIEKGASYEIYILQPVFLDTVVAAGRDRYVTSDNVSHKTLREAELHLLRENGHEDVAETRPRRVKQHNVVQVAIRQILEANCWEQFCRMTSHNPFDASPDKTVELSVPELQRLGLKLQGA